MKLQITDNTEKPIQGYEHLVIDNIEGFKEIVDHCCTDILLLNCLNDVDQETASQVIQAACLKLRQNGKIKIDAVDPKILCRSVANNQLDINHFNNIIKDAKSFLSSKDICEVLTKSKILVESCLLEGIKYEITGIRKA